MHPVPVNETKGGDSANKTVFKLELAFHTGAVISAPTCLTVDGSGELTVV